MYNIFIIIIKLLLKTKLLLFTVNLKKYPFFHFMNLFNCIGMDVYL